MFDLELYWFQKGAIEVGLHVVDPGGVLKFGFGRDVLPWNLKVDPYKYQFFKKK